MDNKNMQGANEQVVNENKGRGLFYAVIAVATFIIMAVGATFAYFTATTNSANSSVKTGSTTLKLKYIGYEAGWMNQDLIPANTEVTEYSFENQNDTTIKADSSTGEASYKLLKNGLCKDDFGNSICSVYVFQVRNDANSPQTVALNVASEENSFASLNAMAYEISLPEDLNDYNSTESNNGLTDPKFTKKDGTDPELSGSTIDVVGVGFDSSDSAKSTILPLKKDNNDGYSPIFINRKGVTKTLLKYIASSDSDLGTSVKKPAIDRLLVPTVDSDGSPKNFENDSEKSVKVADDIEIDGGVTKTFALVLYIKNAQSDQTASDAAKNFTGSVVVSSGDGSTGVSGSIGLVTEETKKNLQSQQ